MTEMNSSRPYLVRALYEWILDNQCTPYLLVNAEYPDTAVPAGFVEDGQIVLNLSPSAVRQLDMDNDRICFDGRFGGVAQLQMAKAHVIETFGGGFAGLCRHVAYSGLEGLQRVFI